MGHTQSTAVGGCPGCGEINEPGMAFCINCGQALVPQPAESAGQGNGTVCPSCGVLDEMKHTFCVECGASMSPQMPKMSTFPTGTVAAGGQQQAWTMSPAIAKPAANFTILAALVGISAGVGLAFVARNAGLLNVLTHSGLPRHGLVIFAQPPEANVMIQERSGKSFTVGRTGKSGSLSLPDLPPGTYRLTLYAGGHIPVVKDVEIEDDKPAVLGFPARIELAPER